LREDLARLLLLEVLREHHGETELRRAAKRTPHELRIHRVPERRHEHAEGTGGLSAQAPGGRVRAVAELAGGVDHALPELLADAQRRVLVQDARCDRLRSSRDVGHVGQPRPDSRTTVLQVTSAQNPAIKCNSLVDGVL
jgi:hypothetical protein